MIDPAAEGAIVRVRGAPLARGRWVWLLIAGVGLALRLGIACRDLDTLDRLFISDDAYYTFSIARSLAHGAGPTVDGRTLTNGFQPLLAFLEVPLFWIWTAPDAPVRATLFGLAVLDVALALVLGRVIARLAGRAAGWLVASFWSTSPQAVRLALGGLETTLALFCTLAMTELWCVHRTRRTRRSAAWLGLSIGVSLLARVDTIFFVVLLGLCELRRDGRRSLPWIVASAACVVTPWWAYSLARFGTIIPQSGPAVRELAFLYQGPHVRTLALLWSAPNVIGAALVQLPQLQEVALRFPLVGLAIACCWWSVYGVAAVFVTRRFRSVATLPTAVLLAHAAVLTAFYVVEVPVIWFFRRYLGVAQLGTCLLVGLVLVALARSQWRGGRWVAAAVVLACGSIATGQSLRYLVVTPSLAEISAIDHTSGYRAPMRAALGQLPAGAVVGSLQSGALGYYAPPAIEVVNLDGVVNSAAARALADYQLDAYALSRGVRYFCDWPLQHQLYAKRAGKRIEFRELWKAEEVQASGHRVTLSSISREDPS